MSIRAVGESRGKFRRPTECLRLYEAIRFLLCLTRVRFVIALCKRVDMNRIAHEAGISRITKTPHQQQRAQFTEMSASIPAVTSLRDLFLFSTSQFLPPAPFLALLTAPKSNLPPPPSTDESTPWHPTAFTDSATQGNQDGYRVSISRIVPDVSTRSDIRKRSR